MIGSLTGQFSAPPTSKHPPKLLPLPLDYLYTPYHPAAQPDPHPSFVIYRNGVAFKSEIGRVWRKEEEVNKALVKQVQGGGQKLFIPNLMAVDSFDDQMLHGILN